MEENKKKRRPPRPAPDVDIAGPAAWGEDRPSAPRRRVRRKPEAAGDAGPGIRRPKTDGPAKAAPKTKAAPKAKKASKPKKRSLKMRFLIWMIWSCLGLGVLGVAAGVVGYSYIDQDLPSTDGLKNYAPPIVTYIYSDDGRVIGEYSHERRFVVPVEKISPLLINAIIAVEDDKFYDHNGVNYKAILRAAIANYRSGETVQGGSTITQQVVKTFLLTPERTYTRKFKEMILAYRIENNLTKEEILYLYLNQIYLGRGAYGVEAAARTYFGKSALDLNLTEAAQIAGIIRNPSKNPVNDPAHGRDRMLTALQRMEETGFITAEERAAARDVKMNFMVEWPNPNTTVTPYFTEHVRRILEERFGADSLYNDGWKVYTTVNVDAQNAADAAVAKGLWEYARRRGYKGPVEELEGDAAIDAFLAKSAKELPDEGLELNHLYLAVVTSVDKKDNALTVQAGPYQGLIAKKNLDWALKKTDISKRFKKGDVVWVRLLSENELEKKQAPDHSGFISGSLTAAPLDFSLEQRTDIQSALLSMDLENGDIKAMVGGRDFSESQFNRAVQSQRQPGSSFKPILYASAMDNGFTPGSIMNDAPFVIDDPGSGKRWKPVNSDLKFKGPMTLYTALVGSRNLISIKILDRIGYDALAATARDLGITEKLPEYLAVALGAHGVRIPELVTAYSAFANMGVRVEPRYITRIEDRNGNIVESFEPKRTEALDPGSACAVTWMLRGVVDHGTGTAVKALKRPVGGKTGTTNDYSDAWFIGFTPELVTAVWVGTDEQRPRAVGETGGRVAGPIFLYYMREALKDVPITDFTVPPEAEIAPGGSFGICYKAGTIGTGFSETINADTPEDEFLREDFEDMEGEILGGDEGPDGAWDQPEPERSSGGLFNRIFSRQPQERPSSARPSDTPRPSQAPAGSAAPAPDSNSGGAIAPPPQSPPSTPASGGDGRSSSGRLKPYGSGGASSGGLRTYGDEE